MSKMTIIEGNSNDKDNVRTYMVKGERGFGIASVEKTSTDVLTDTYTITFDDGKTTTFEVNNGNGIESIEKTATVGLVDTYTITFTNGDTTTFDVTNGKDGENAVNPIIEVSKVGDTATITITDAEGTKSVELKDGEITKAMVVDNLESTTTDVPLSANQGRVLNELINYSMLKFHSIANSSATYIVELPNDKYMFIDTGQPSQWTDIKNAIDGLGITKFDYGIITHFHSDHAGNIQNFFDNYDLTDCQIWVGMKPDFTNHSSEIDQTEANYDDVITLLTTNGVTPVVPTNDSYVVIDDNTKLHFLNTSSTIAENYYGRIKEYGTEEKINFNYFSLVTEIIHNKVKILSTGDIERGVEEALTPYMSKTNILISPHHGINRDAHKPFYYAIQPDYSIVSYISDNWNWVNNSYKSFSYLKELNSNIITAKSNIAVNGLFSFISDGHNVYSGAMGSYLDENIVETPRIYSRLDQCINYSEQTDAGISLNEVISNMFPGSMLKFIWNYENTKYVQVYDDLQTIFPNFNNEYSLIEINKIQNSSLVTIKVHEVFTNLTYEAEYGSATGWTNQKGTGSFSTISGIDNLISTIRKLPVGNYKVASYSQSTDDVLVQDGGYVLDINIINKTSSNDCVATLMAYIRNTGSTTNPCRCASGYINTTGSPSHVWLRLNNAS